MRGIGFIAIFITLCCPALKAQLCNGSLGDPILNVTFGIQAGGGPELPVGQTTYNYTTKGCPKENEYSLKNFVFGCFDDAWHPLVGDHTPADQDGFYMLVNSAYVKGDLFAYTLKGLCPGTKYEFSAWVKNVLRKTACSGSGIDPDLTFKVETLSGTTITSYSTGNIIKEDDGKWMQYGTLFQAPDGVTDVVLHITSSAGQGCGNAMALDDITVRPCGPAINAIVVSNGLNSVDVCDGSNADFLLTSNYGSGFTNPAFQWQIRNGQSWDNIPGATSKNYLRPATREGIYMYRVLIAEAGRPFSPQCRIGSNDITINVLAAPFVQATGYIYGCLDGEVILLASGANSYLWTGPNGFTSTEQRPVLKRVSYSDSGTYKVTGTTYAGCVKSDSTVLKVYPKATASSSEGRSICEGTSITLVASGGSRYYWEPSATLSSDTVATPIARPMENTVYNVRVINQYGCTDTASIKVNVWKKPHSDAGPDLKTRLGLPLGLRGSAKGSDVSWFWTPSPGTPSAQSLRPVINPPQTTTYTLHVVSPYGCGTHTDNVVVKVYEKVLIPNAFSPNGDGINDTWYIDPLEFFNESTTEVYNRSGQLVHRSEGYTAPWNGTSNGKPLPVGTYFYIIDLGVQNQPKLTGSITILR